MNVRKLKAKIVENGLTQEQLAKKMGISVQNLNAKLNNRANLTLNEVISLVKILNITDPVPIFFDNIIPQMQRWLYKLSKNVRKLGIESLLEVKGDDKLLELLTVKDIINHLKIDKMTAYRLIKDGQIKAVNIGTEKRPKYRILKTEYEKFLRGEQSWQFQYVVFSYSQ